ncbi:MAG: hypothetical protein VXY99_06645, partial [Pseudomonadota bacterium]|nr:hypothetical protein [Pseudomonadota bacterium]
MLVRFIFAICIFFSSYSFADKTSLSLAILSYNPDVNTVVLYQSILNEMSEQLSEYEFELTVLDTETLVKESTYHDFDFFLLDPVSFLTLRSIGVVGGTLGTLSRGDGSLSANLMGGVII